MPISSVVSDCDWAQILNPEYRSRLTRLTFNAFAKCFAPSSPIPIPSLSVPLRFSVVSVCQRAVLLRVLLDIGTHSIDLQCIRQILCPCNTDYVTARSSATKTQKSECLWWKILLLALVDDMINLIFSQGISEGLCSYVADFVVVKMQGCQCLWWIMDENVWCAAIETDLRTRLIFNASARCFAPASPISLCWRFRIFSVWDGWQCFKSCFRNRYALDSFLMLQRRVLFLHHRVHCNEGSNLSVSVVADNFQSVNFDLNLLHWSSMHHQAPLLLECR